MIRDLRVPFPTSRNPTAIPVLLVSKWALENKRVTGDTVAESDVIPYLKAAPVCPASGSYTPNAVGTPPVCSKSAAGHTL